MRIAYYNVLDYWADTYVPVASSTLTGFPITNVVDERLATKWKSDTATSQSVVCRIDKAAVNTVGILGHNCTTTCSIIISGNDTDSWGSPSFTTSVSVITTGACLKYLSENKTYNYWKFEFSGQASLEIGRLWLGTYLTIDPSSLLDFKIKLNTTDVVSFGRNRQKFGIKGTTWRGFSLSFPQSSSSMVTSIMDMYTYSGTSKSLIFCNFDDIRTYPIVEPCYCSISETLEFIHTTNMRFTYNLHLLENL